MGKRILVIGAGVEGLVCAAELAGAGHQVTVLEALDNPGGLFAGGPIGDVGRHDGFWPVADHLSDAVVAALSLEKHGLTRRSAPPTLAVNAQRGVFLTAEGAASVGDGEGFAAHHAFLDRVLPLARTWLSEPAPRLGEADSLVPLARKAVALRRLGRDTMMELLRVGPSCVDDFLAESFQDPLIRAGLALPALHGSWMGPRSPQSTALYLLHHAMRTQPVEGGPAGLVRALVACCASRGVQTQCGARVDRLTLSGGAVTGVTLGDGSQLQADVVMSTIGPVETLNQLLPPQHRDASESYAVSRIRTRGTWAALHVHIEGRLQFTAAPQTHVKHVIVADDAMHIERCFDDVKYRRLPRRPVLDVTIRPAEGGCNLSIQTLVGHEQDHGWNADVERQLTVDVLEALSAVTVRLTSDRIRAVQLVTPAHCEDTWHHRGGHPLHGELALDQLWALRPTRALAQHQTATPGLWLASTGTGPGSMGSGLAGLHAAQLLNG